MKAVLVKVVKAQAMACVKMQMQKCARQSLCLGIALCAEESLDSRSRVLANSQAQQVFKALG